MICIPTEMWYLKEKEYSCINIEMKIICNLHWRKKTLVNYMHFLAIYRRILWGVFN